MLHAKTVGPSILHGKQDENCEDTATKITKARLSAHKCIKNRTAKPCLHEGDDHHADEHLAGINILIGDHELNPARANKQT